MDSFEIVTQLWYLDVTPKLWISLPKFERYRIQLCYVVFSANNGTNSFLASKAKIMVLISKVKVVRYHKRLGRNNYVNGYSNKRCSMH